MCGINGIFAYAESAPPVDEAELLRTREHMIKRGPDGAGLWITACDPSGKPYTETGQLQGGMNLTFDPAGQAGFYLCGHFITKT